MWVIQIYNPSESLVKVTMVVNSPLNVQMRNLALYEHKNSASPTIALFVHLLERYINDIPTASQTELAIKETLDKIPNARLIVKTFTTNWQIIPKTRKKVIFGKR